MAPLPPELSEALALYDAGDIDACRKHVQGLHEVSHPSIPPEAYLLEGLCLRKLGNLEGAIEQMQQTVELAPQNAYAWMELGLATIEYGETERGLDLLREAVRVSGDAPRYRHEFYVQNGIALYGAGYAEHAATSLRKALKFEQEAETYRILAHLLLELNQHKEAFDVITEGIEHFGDDAELQHIAGLALALKHQPFEAAQAFARAIELDPHNADPLHSLGLCFEALHDVARAIEAYKRCLTLQCSAAVRADAEARVARLSGEQ